MATTRQKIGHALAKGLGIRLDYRNETGDDLTRGESVFSVSSADSYIEEEPTAQEWLREVTPGPRDMWNYAKSLFPFTSWIGRYNLQWFAGDLVAGITIGAVVVPQGMAYAKLAELPVEFGLYSSFMGVLLYWFFATSKDITIGPVAVMSTIVGDIVLNAAKEAPQYQGYQIAEALAIVVGAIVVAIGLLRLGWLVDFISLTAISAFMTGSALNIAAGQVPTLLGIPTSGTGTHVNTHGAFYSTVIQTLQQLPNAGIDAAMGMTALFLLYLIRSVFNLLARKQPHRAKLWFFCSTLRTAFVILLYTLISWLVNLHLRNHNSKYSPFKILGTVPRGFKYANVPVLNSDIISVFSDQIPASVIVLLIEHISIAKSFGRVNNYVINPSQELVAIGVTNCLGPFLGAYPATGSFSRTAIKSKAGVRTPFAGVITAIVVLLAIYALPAVFFYIPSASLSAVIIHAVGDLITPPNTVYQFWRISPLDVVIFFAGVLVTCFASIEDGVYTTVAVSAALLLWRVFKARGRFLGKLAVHSVVGDQYLEGELGNMGHGKDADRNGRNVFVPINHGDGSNPNVKVDHPYPGIFIYRFSEGYNYPNANHYLDHLTSTVFSQTRRTNPNTYGRPGDRPWNDPGPKKGHEHDHDDLPTLKAIVLDFSSVNNVDITSIQNLIDVRNQLDKYASPESVQWHFASINNRWTKRALVAAGFGYLTPSSTDGFHRWKPIFSVAEIGGNSSAAAAAEMRHNRKQSQLADVERSAATASNTEEIFSAQDSDSHRSIDKGVYSSTAENFTGSKIALVNGMNRPLFHIDLTSALQSAIANYERNVHGERPSVPHFDSSSQEAVPEKGQ